MVLKGGGERGRRPSCGKVSARCGDFPVCIRNYGRPFQLDNL